MDLNQYTYMFEAEDRHWWYRGNHEHFLYLLRSRQLLKEGISFLDAGCGTGKWLERVSGTVRMHYAGFDFQEKALDYARTRGLENLTLWDINKAFGAAQQFDLVSSFDVLCNASVDVPKALGNLNRCLKPGGHLLLTLPAYNFLKSTHDAAVHTQQRFTRKQVRALLEQNGFAPVKVTYTVCLLFPPALFKRMADRLFQKPSAAHNEVKIPAPFINRLFLGIMRAENFMLRYLSLPFGLSVVALAQKQREI